MAEPTTVTACCQGPCSHVSACLPADIVLQVMKIAVAPTVLLLELLMFGTVPPPRVAAAVLVVCAGVAVATISDTHMVRNTTGIAVGMAATVMTALYQVRCQTDRWMGG